MFAFEKEICGLIKKDPLCTESERKQAMMAVSCKANGCVRFSAAAERLGVCKAVVYRLVREKKLVGVRLTGNRPYGVSEESLDAFIESRKVR